MYRYRFREEHSYEIVAHVDRDAHNGRGGTVWGEERGQEGHGQRADGGYGSPVSPVKSISVRYQCHQSV